LTLEDLADLETWPVARAEHAATKLIDRGLAVGTPGGVVLAHDIIRSTASRLLPDSAQRSLHRRLEHREAGRLPTSELALRLARSPRRRWLGSDGLRELAAIAAGTDPGSEEHELLDQAIAELASELRDHPFALERWVALADATTDDRRRQSALLGAAREAYHLERGARAAVREWPVGSSGSGTCGRPTSRR
jgi:hypothetical protein